jgi:hypothetical protein
LFLNENAVYGETPTGSLYSEYWETYVDLLYKPTTRLFNCQAIIPLADYFKMELNDIVEWRGNYYHLRAINDYNLSNGEAGIQLLGPVLGDVIANTLPGIPCNFDFSIESYTAPLECCAPVITSASLSGPNVEILFTTSSGCLDCIATTIQLSTDNVNWGGNNTGGCSSPRSITAPTSSVYYRMYTDCTGSVSSSVSNSYLYVSGSGGSGSATLAWTFSEMGGATGVMDISVNGVNVESRNYTSAGTYFVNVGDTIEVEINVSGCYGFNTKANAYCTGIINDAACGDYITGLNSTLYTVVSGDIGTTLDLDNFATCDSACV